MSKTYNLDIHSYSLKDLFCLFEIPFNENIRVEHLKLAKKKVMMIHPDKSGLPSEYFHFYKSAFDVIIQFYKNQNKQNQTINEETTKYKIDEDDTISSIQTVVNKYSKPDFNKKFNQLFEQNMSQKIDTSRNDWFSSEKPVYEIDEKVTAKNMNTVFNRIKEQQHSLIQYTGKVQTLTSGLGTDLYADIEDENNGEKNENKYVSCDPFSKLKYDDLRKVHKDQTVFAVSEKDIANVPKYASLEHYTRERGGHSIQPLSTRESETMLKNENKVYQEYIRQKEYAAELKLQLNKEKNKSILANFLRLQ